MTDAEARDAIIIALDMSREEALELCDKLKGRARWVKVGMTLFYRYGPSIVDEMRERGLNVFLDLKLHDIPFQIRGAAYAASLSGADILSIHGLGGAQMIAEGRAGAEEAAAGATVPNWWRFRCSRAWTRRPSRPSAWSRPWRRRCHASQASRWARGRTASCARPRRPTRCARCSDPTP